jgi:hypothetical protein
MKVASTSAQVCLKRRPVTCPARGYVPTSARAASTISATCLATAWSLGNSLVASGPYRSRYSGYRIFSNGHSCPVPHHDVEGLGAGEVSHDDLVSPGTGSLPVAAADGGLYPALRNGIFGRRQRGRPRPTRLACLSAAARGTTDLATDPVVKDTRLALGSAEHVQQLAARRDRLLGVRDPEQFVKHGSRLTSHRHQAS